MAKRMAERLPRFRDADRPFDDGAKNDAWRNNKVKLYLYWCRAAGMRAAKNKPTQQTSSPVMIRYIDL